MRKLASGISLTYNNGEGIASSIVARLVTLLGFHFWFFASSRTFNNSSYLPPLSSIIVACKREEGMNTAHSNLPHNTDPYLHLSQITVSILGTGI